MKYFKVFNTESEYLAYVASEDFISPNVSTLRDCTNTWINPELHDYSKDYFTIESLEDNNEIKFGRSVGGGDITELHIAASTDNGGTWTEYTLPYENGQYEITTINSGDKIIFKYISGGFKRGAFTNTYFVTSGSFNVYGNVMSLVKAGNFSDATTSYGVPFLLKNSKVVSAKNLIFPKNASIDASSHYGMFSGCTSLIEAPELPATTLATSCYYSMFKDCTSLTETPELPATTLANDCYMEMFKGCTSLTATTELAAITLTIDCYRGMFDGCTSLATTPELPATTLATRCYRSMFGNCTNLEEAPELPATTLANDCYRYMFGGCTSLMTAPALPATILSSNCYQEMFKGCTSLTTAPELLATTLANDCYYQMFENCTSLATAPSVLPAATVPNKAYYEMFNQCMSLMTAPSISATSFGSESCRGMFYGCTSLTTTQATLSATTLGAQCCRGMYMNCTSLTTAPELLATTLADSCYYDMFNGCSSLTTVQSVLPATTLEASCYRAMFANTTALTKAPTLSAETVAANACTDMFNGCTALTTVQSELPATTMADYCYKGMFFRCSSLTVAPSLPATTLASHCYTQMFGDCQSLTTAPELPATTLVSYCYSQMFGGCKSLTVAPELPATMLVNNCYHQMFKGCSNINYVKCLATDISASECTKEWLYQTPNNSGCTFVKASTMGDWTRDSNGIPDKWTVHNDTYVEVTGVTISASEATVNKGSTYILRANVLPSNAYDQVISWSTSDSNVATVSDGVVTGVGCGDATITVTTHEKEYTATCNISVENHVTSVDLNTYIVTIATGNTYQLEAIVSPSDACDKSVTWSSSNSGIASVDSNGRVSGVTTGSATVTVTSNDTNSATCNCSVTVNEGQHATGVTLSNAAITVNKDEIYTLTATVLPIDAVDKTVTWSSSNENVASVDSNGVVSGVASGDATITVTTVDGGLTAQCSVSVSEEHDYSKDYFTIESLVDGNEIKMQRAKTPNNPTLSYSLDDGETWTTATISGTKSFGTINTSNKIIFKGTNTNLATAWDAYNYFTATKQFKVYGNVMSLLNGDDFKTNYEFNSGQTNHCAGLLRTTYLVDASNLILPAQTLYTNSYNGMFRGAIALQHGPKMLAITPTGTECCASMFEECINLEEPIEINFTTLAQQCCFRMFCMNRNSKITTPKMTKSPILRCNTAVQDCYKEMFEGNGNLNEITCLLTNNVSATANWVQYAGADTGTFYKHPDKTWTQGKTYGVPTGWTVVDYVEE